MLSIVFGVFRDRVSLCWPSPAVLEITLDQAGLELRFIFTGLWSARREAVVILREFLF